MPGRDQTGPAGAGSMTGRGQGLCVSKDASGEKPPVRGMGRGFLRGMGRGLGRGMGRGLGRGLGLGRRAGK